MLIDSLTTDSNGVIVIENLPVGEYKLKETVAPDGYLLPSNSLEFSITKSDNDKLEYSITNAKEPVQPVLKGNVLLVKYDERACKRLQNAEFKIVDSKGNVIKENLVTNSKGEIEVKDLEVGKYQFIETKAPNGYKLDETPINFEIIADKTTTVKAYNTKDNSCLVKPGNVKLTKYDKRSCKRLQNAEFKIVDSKGNVIKENLVTDRRGEIEVKDLKVGKYQFIETKAPNGYKLDETPINFEIKSRRTTTVKAYNTKDDSCSVKPGNVELTKYDKRSCKRLQNAEFKIVDSKGNVVKENLVTDRKGEIEVKGLKVGKYQFIETKAPSGYKLDKTPINFEIRSGKTTEVKVYNTKESSCLSYSYYK